MLAAQALKLDQSFRDVCCDDGPGAPGSSEIGLSTVGNADFNIDDGQQDLDGILEFNDYLLCVGSENNCCNHCSCDGCNICCKDIHGSLCAWICGDDDSCTEQKNCAAATHKVLTC